MKTKTERPGQRGKSVPERVGFALSHRIRVQVLTLLNEGIYTADDIAALIGESRQSVGYHLKELLDCSSIEIARIEKKRNADLHYYRAVEMPSFDQEALAAMTTAERQATAGLIVQCSTAEVMASLAAGKLSDDPRVCLMWRWFHLDELGRDALTEEQDRFWERVQEMEAASLNRGADSGERTRSYIVGEWGYERVRSAPQPLVTRLPLSATLSAGTKRLGLQCGSVQERVGFALGHRVRVEVLTLLNEGIYTADDISALIGESRQNVHYHLKELLDRGSIEIAWEEKKRNADLHYYRAVEMPSFDQKALAAMTPDERQEIAGLIVQCSTAEVMAALAAGKLSDDPRVCLMWRWFHLDERGRDELADGQDRFWERVQEIETSSIARAAESGEETTSCIVGQWGYERSRSAPVPANKP